MEKPERKSKSPDDQGGQGGFQRDFLGKGNYVTNVLRGFKGMELHSIFHSEMRCSGIPSETTTMAQGAWDPCCGHPDTGPAIFRISLFSEILDNTHSSPYCRTKCGANQRNRNSNCCTNNRSSACIFNHIGMQSFFSHFYGARPCC